MDKKPSSSEEIRFMAVGDMMFCCELGEKLSNTNNYDYPFDKVRKFLDQADFLYGNLETMITAVKKPEGFAKPGIYYADTLVGGAIARAGFDLVSLAHNHMYDFGFEGVEHTMEVLAEGNVQYHGIGRELCDARKSFEVNVKGIRLGLLSYCNASTAIDSSHRYVACPIKEEFLQKDISELAKRVDVVIVTLHEGICSYPSPQYRKWAKLAIDSGASLVLGHHPHVINGIEEYCGGVIAYGLGDFIATFEGKKSSRSFVLDCLIKPDGSIEYQTVPVIINDDLQVEKATGEIKNQIMESLKELNRKLSTDESDKAYFETMKKDYVGLMFRDVLRGVRGEGLSAIFRKIRKIRWHHLRLIFGGILKKFW